MEETAKETGLEFGSQEKQFVFILIAVFQYRPWEGHKESLFQWQKPLNPPNQ